MCKPADLHNYGSVNETENENIASYHGAIGILLNWCSNTFITDQNDDIKASIFLKEIIFIFALDLLINRAMTNEFEAM